MGEENLASAVGSKHLRAEGMEQAQPKDSKAQVLQPGSLSVRLTHQVFTKAFLPFCTVTAKGDKSLKLEDRRKYGDYSRLDESHKSGLIPTDRAYALKDQMESSGKATLKDIREWIKLSAKPFSSKKITHLDVSRSDISNVELHALVRSMPNLIGIDAEDSTGLTNKGLEHIGKHCKMLQFLNVSNCEVTDAGLEHIGKGCTGLLSLNVACCEEVRDAGLGYIGKGCIGLLSLDVSGCCDLTDDGIKHIGEGLHKLLSIDVSWCIGVTDLGVKYVEDGCHKLRSFNACLCFQVTEVGIQSLMRKLPDLTVKK